VHILKIPSPPEYQSFLWEKKYKKCKRERNNMENEKEERGNINGKEKNKMNDKVESKNKRLRKE
jgi:hypothetical protein